MVKGEIKPIENEHARQICFSKRRQSLFKKACELTILCGATVGSVVFSPFGRPFTFGHPSIDIIAHRFVNSVTPNGLVASGSSSQDNSGAVVTDTINRLNTKILDLQLSLEYEKKEKERLQEATEKQIGEPMMKWLNSNIMELGLDELQEFQKSLEAVHEVISGPGNFPNN